MKTWLIWFLFLTQVSSLSGYSLFFTLLNHHFMGSSPSSHCSKVCSLNFTNSSEHSEQSCQVYKCISLSGIIKYQSYLCLDSFRGLINVFNTRVVQYTQSVMGRQTGDGLWWIMTTRHRLSVRDMLAIEHRPPHFFECLWHHYFRTRNIVTLLSPVYLSCLRNFATRHELSPLLTTHCGAGVLDMYVQHQGNWISQVENRFELKFFLRKIFLKIVKPGGQNHLHSQFLNVWSLALMKRQVIWIVRMKVFQTQNKSSICVQFYLHCLKSASRIKWIFIRNFQAIIFLEQCVD